MPSSTYLAVLMLIHSGTWTDIRVLVFDNDADEQVQMLTVDQFYWLVVVVISEVD